MYDIMRYYIKTFLYDNLRLIRDTKRAVSKFRKNVSFKEYDNLIREFFIGYSCYYQ